MQLHCIWEVIFMMKTRRVSEEALWWPDQGGEVGGRAGGGVPRSPSGTPMPVAVPLSSTQGFWLSCSGHSDHHLCNQVTACHCYVNSNASISASIFLNVGKETDLHK